MADRDQDGCPRTVLGTANHVLWETSRVRTSIEFLLQVLQDWTYSPVDLEVRDRDGAPLWQTHPSRDVPTIEVSVPPAMAQKAIPPAYLANDASFDQNTIVPGEDFIGLCYPRGLPVNVASFPILRSARLASYPLVTASRSPALLPDFFVLPRQCGDPVLVSTTAPDRRGRPGLFAGMLAQQVEFEQERMDIGIITHAQFLRERDLGLIDRNGPAMSARPGHAPPCLACASL